MKRFLILSIALILMVYLVTGCKEEVTIYTDPEQPISVKVNQEFIIATSTNPPTGYMWRENYDESMVELLASTIEVSEAVKRGEAEIGLEQHFRFKTLKKAETVITIELAGPDLKSIIEKKVFNVNIK